MRKTITGPAERTRRIRAILGWYSRNGRTLPWRNIADPYRLLVSEIMLHQTQVSRVLTKYPLFLRRFPTLPSLARARRRDVIVAWQGMGYNNRAVRLHQLAREIIANHGGKVPSEFGVLRSLPGIGKYTANALLCAAFDRQVPAVEVNVRRVLSRMFWTMRTFDQVGDEGDIWKLAEGLLPRGKAYPWNQALMDLGALVCTARRPQCVACPVSGSCASAGRMQAAPGSPRRNERSLDGVPNRLYRGRIINELRGRSNGMKTAELGRQIHPAYSARHQRWLEELIEGLRKDGLIALAGTGPFRSQRVSLA